MGRWNRHVLDKHIGHGSCGACTGSEENIKQCSLFISVVRLGWAAAPKSSILPVLANLGSSRSHHLNLVSCLLLILSTYTLPSFPLTLPLSLSPSFISTVIGPLPYPNLWHNTTWNSPFKPPFCKVLSPFTLPKHCWSVAASFTIKFLLPLACLTAHQRDTTYKSHSCQRRLLRSLLDLEEDFIVIWLVLVVPVFITLGGCTFTFISVPLGHSLALSLYLISL